MVTLFVIFAGSISLYQIKKVTKPLEHSILSETKTIVLDSKQEHLIFDLHHYDGILGQAVRNYAFRQEPKWKDRYTEYKRRTNALINTLLKSGQTQNANFLHEIQEVYQQLVDLETKALMLSDQRRTTDALNILGGPDYWNLKDRYNTMILNYARQSSHRYEKNIEKHYAGTLALVNQARHYVKNTEKTILVIWTLALVIAGVMGVFLYQSLSVPLKKLIKATREIGKRQFDTRIDTLGNNEINDLAISLRNMMNSLKEKTRSVNELNEINQRMKIKEHQLKTANEDLLASEQQLKALNQQLSASEQELRALNQNYKNQSFILKERLKETDCLYNISKCLDLTSSHLPDILQKCVNLLPSGWQYPGITHARIVYQNREYRTEPFKPTEWKQSADIITNQKKSGVIEIYYSQEKPVFDEGPFLNEERDLLNEIASRISIFMDFFHVNKKFRNQEKHYRNLVNNIPGIVYRCRLDQKRSMLFLTQNVYELTGYSTSEFLDNKVINFQRIIHSEDRTMVEEKIAHSRSRMIPVEMEYRIVHKDQNLRWIYEKGQPVVDDERKEFYLEGIMFEISDRKRIQTELTQRYKTLENLNKGMKGREHRIMELKERIKELERELRALRKKANDS